MRRALMGASMAAAVAGCTEKGMSGFPLDPPARISAQAQPSGGVSMFWDPVPGATEYRIYVAPTDGVTSENYLALGGFVQSHPDPHAYPYPGDPVHASMVVTSVAGGRESRDSARVHAYAENVPAFGDAPDQLIPEPSDQEARFGAAMAAGDVNCDGRDDLVVGAPEVAGNGGGGMTSLFLGRGLAVSAVADLFHGSANGFGASVALGAVSGSEPQCAEILVGGPRFTTDTGEAFLYNGNDSNFGNQIWTQGGTNAGDRFGDRVAILGDVDGDGLGDFAVTAPLEPGTAQVEFFAGSLAYPSTTPFATYQLGGGAPDPITITAIGDVTGDGRADVLLGAPGTDFGGGPEHGRALVLSYPVDTFQIVWDSDGSETANEHFGFATLAIDMNEDGLRDLVIGSPGADDGAGGLDVYLQDEVDGFPDASAGRVPGLDSAAQFAWAFAPAGDVDGVGEDFFVSSPAYSASRGRVQLFRGSGDGRPTSIWSVDGTEPGGRFGESITTGDFDGDGRLDLAIGTPGRTSVTLGADAGEAAIFLQRVGYSPLPDAGDVVEGKAGERLRPQGAWFSDPSQNRHWRCTWDAGDGSATRTIDPCVPETVDELEIIWTEPGTYALRLRVERVNDGRYSESVTRVVIE